MVERMGLVVEDTARSLGYARLGTQLNLRNIFSPARASELCTQSRRTLERLSCRSAYVQRRVQGEEIARSISPVWCTVYGQARTQSIEVELTAIYYNAEGSWPSRCRCQPCGVALPGERLPSVESVSLGVDPRGPAAVAVPAVPVSGEAGLVAGNAIRERT